jgi:hypothetical protein
MTYEYHAGSNPAECAECKEMFLLLVRGDIPGLVTNDINDIHRKRILTHRLADFASELGDYEGRRVRSWHPKDNCGGKVRA